MKINRYLFTWIFREPVKAIFIGVVFLFLTGCSNKERRSSLQIIDLTQKVPERDLKFSDLCSDVHLVRLETNDSCLIPSWYQLWVGDRYILVFTGKSIYQFDTQGKLIRRLARSGKGPGEFIRVICYDVDVQNNILYLGHEGNDNTFNSYDLVSGRFIREIPKVYKVQPMFYGLILEDPGTLAVLSSLWQLMPDEIYFQDTCGKRLGGFPNKNKEVTGFYTGKMPFFKKIDGESYYMPGESDTVYKIMKDTLLPVYWLKTPETFHFIGNPEGYLVSVMMLSDSWMFMKQTHKRVRIVNDNYDEKIYSKRLYLYDIKNKKLARVTELWFDPLFMKKEFPLFYQYHNKCVWAVNASDFKDYAENALSEHKLPPKELHQLEILNNTISPEDNPLLVIGTVK